MKKTRHTTTHNDSLPALARIEGQVRGIRQMVKDGKYCIDIISQLHAAQRAILSVSERILAKHISSCVYDAFSGTSERKKQKKIDELICVIKHLHRL